MMRKCMIVLGASLFLAGCHPTAKKTEGPAKPAEEGKTAREKAVALANAIGRPTELARRISREHQWSSPFTGRISKGADEAVLHARELEKAFAGLDVIPRRVIEGHDFVAVEGELSGTNTSGFAGHAPFNGPARGDFVQVSFVRGGELTSTSLYLDVDGLMRGPKTSTAGPRTAQPPVVFGKPLKASKRVLSQLLGILSYTAAAKVAETKGDSSFAIDLEKTIAPSVIEPKLALLKDHRSDIPDLQAKIVDLYAAGPILVAKGIATGTVSSKPVAIPMLVVAELANDEVLKFRTYGRQLR